MDLLSGFFIGHRDAPEIIKPRLSEAIERHIAEYGVTEFVVGHYGAFDRMAAHALGAAKQRHPSVTLMLLIPYRPAEYPVELPKGFDSTFYPPDMESVPRKVAIIRANEYMVRASSHLITYAHYHIGNTYELVEMALRREERGQMHVENLAEK